MMVIVFSFYVGIVIKVYVFDGDFVLVGVFLVSVELFVVGIVLE